MTELESEYRALIDSRRVSSRTRAALLARLERPQELALKGGLSEHAVSLLQTMAERIVPTNGRYIDFGAKINARLASGKGKGWRYSELPPDLAAYRLAINTVNIFYRNKFDIGFVEAGIEKQNETLKLIQSGEMPPIPLESRSLSETLNAAQMQRWFEDLRGDVVWLYMSHPETLAQIGYSGIADGGDSTALTGFVQLGLGQVEPWEPRAGGASE